MSVAHTRALLVPGLAAGALVVIAPLAGWPPVVRLSAVIVGAGLLAALLLRPWRLRSDAWRAIATYAPSRRTTGLAAAAAGLLLFWIVLTLFRGGHINGGDFTVYFDRPLYQTLQGRPLYVETSDQPVYAHRTHLGVHSYWVLLPLAALYAVHATPIWLLALSVIAVVAGAGYIARIGRHIGLGGALSCAAAFAFLFNDNTARTLRFGFHAEVLYAWFIPWLIDAGLRRARGEFFVAALAAVLVKEDAILPLFAAVAALALVQGRAMTRAERGWFLAMPLALALTNLFIYLQFVAPALWPGGTVAYSYLWSHYGATPVRALAGMAAHPLSVARDLVSSGLLIALLPPFLFLPLVGWRWSVGLLPLAAIFATSTDWQLRTVGIYYGIYFVPLLTLAGACGALTVARLVLRPPAVIPAAAAVVALSALVIGPGYALRPWRAETAAVPEAIDRLGSETVVLVQSGLYPHAGYEARVRLLTPDALREPENAGAAILLARGISAFPFSRGAHESLFAWPPISPMPGGLVAVRHVVPAGGSQAAARGEDDTR